MKKNIVAVSAETPNNRIIYVESMTVKDDGNYQITTTFDPATAHDFQDMDRARKFIPKIFNPWNRKYIAHRISVQRKAYSKPETDMS